MRLGAGIYFFINGIGHGAKSDARNWVTYYPRKGENPTHYAVFCGKISAEDDEIWDVRTESGRELFLRAKDEVLQELAKEDKKTSAHLDFLIVRSVTQSNEVKVVINPMAIAFGLEKTLKLKSQTPNTTVLCVCNGHQKCVDGLSLVEEGPITK